MLKRKDKILIGALELLVEGGTNGLTTKKLAAHQGVSEPALYRQYNSKLDIIKALIEEYASFDKKIMDTILESEMLPNKAIEFYVSRFAERYKNYPEITTVMFSMDLYYYNDDTKKMMKEIHNGRLKFLERIIKNGQAIGDMDTHYKPDEMAQMIDGLIYSQVYHWRLEEMKAPLVDQLVSLIQRML